jgi:hypothetical protein
MTITDAHVAGGVELGGTATTSFVHGSDPALSDLIFEWDFDGDGDFDQPEENITGVMVDAESSSGRDWPSQLTGRAGPGSLRMMLRNDDDRFSYFNTASPLTQAPFSLATGRTIRVRTAEAANPDPVLLAKDRFFGSGQLDSTDADELGTPWSRQTTGRFTRQADSAGDTLAVPDTLGATHIATVDVGTDDFYAQVRYKFLDSINNRCGLVYRYQDSLNHGLVYVEAHSIWLVTVVAGTPTVTASASLERRRDVTIGVHVSGGDAVVYLEGVPVISAAAHNDTDTEVGIYSLWEMHRPPSLHELWVWDGLPAETEGILWTGEITSVTSGPRTVSRAIPTGCPANRARSSTAHARMASGVCSSRHRSTRSLPLA